MPRVPEGSPCVNTDLVNTKSRPPLDFLEGAGKLPDLAAVALVNGDDVAIAFIGEPRLCEVWWEHWQKTPDAERNETVRTAAVVSVSYLIAGRVVTSDLATHLVSEIDSPKPKAKRGAR